MAHLNYTNWRGVVAPLRRSTNTVRERVAVAHGRVPLEVHFDEPRFGMDTWWRSLRGINVRAPCKLQVWEVVRTTERVHESKTDLNK